MRRLHSVLCLSGLTTLILVGLTASAAHAHTHSYSIETRGGVTSDVAQFAAIARSTLRDQRGWTLGGSIAFPQVRSGGDFRLVLATPAAVDAAAPGCSRTYSCRVGDQVLINEARWKTATKSWTGSLHNYRHYVINHEVGHYLRLGHRACPSAGAAAPVMQQQSIGLRGCRANTWPLPSERGGG